MLTPEQREAKQAIKQAEREARASAAINAARPLAEKHAQANGITLIDRPAMYAGNLVAFQATSKGAYGREFIGQVCVYIDGSRVYHNFDIEQDHYAHSWKND